MDAKSYRDMKNRIFSQADTDILTEVIDGTHSFESDIIVINWNKKFTKPSY